MSINEMSNKIKFLFFGHKKYFINYFTIRNLICHSNMVQLFKRNNSYRVYAVTSALGVFD